jgi:hypothetical protein
MDDELRLIESELIPNIRFDCKGKILEFDVSDFAAYLS